ncbi:SH3 domain-containing protein [Coprinopsis sp. MPI-PUGE-AT-0042]|nr:SH3 domain-containing protein [Coprinopsis sp. MPI-PUGE-AT-0042]
MPKFSSPLPQPLPKECEKAARIFQSFGDSRNDGLDGVIPRSILAQAKGFAIFTVVKAGFILSARAGSGVVIAKLEDGTWSAPSAIGSGGLGLGTQAGAEMTDFLVVLNSRSRLQSSFMSSGSLNLGGNMSIALGPLGRNGEATGSLNTKGKVAAMYSYSKTRGLFGGVSLEGSVIVERQDANALAYNSPVTARMLLGGMVDPPVWAQPLINVLETCTRFPGGREWIEEHNRNTDAPYMFGSGVSSPAASPTLSRSSSFFSRKKKPQVGFPPASWMTPPDGSPVPEDNYHAAPARRGTFDSDFMPSPSPSRRLSYAEPTPPTNPFTRPPHLAHMRSNSMFTPPSRQSSVNGDDSLADWQLEQGFLANRSKSLSHRRPIQPKPELSRPLDPFEGVARAIALFDFQAVEIITVTKKSDRTEDWCAFLFANYHAVVLLLFSCARWTGKLDGREGIFPANFVELA